MTDGSQKEVFEDLKILADSIACISNTASAFLESQIN